MKFICLKEIIIKQYQFNLYLNIKLSQQNKYYNYQQKKYHICNENNCIYYNIHIFISNPDNLIYFSTNFANICDEYNTINKKYKIINFLLNTVYIYMYLPIMIIKVYQN